MLLHIPLILAILIPIVMLSFEQIKTFTEKLPVYLDNFDEFVFGFPILKQFNFLATDADNIMEQISMSSSDILNHALDIGKSIGKTCMYLFVSVIIIYNFIIDKTKIKNYYLRVFPADKRNRAEEVGKIISNKMGGYLTAMFVASSCVGIVMFLGLLILKIPYALLLSIIAAVLDIIPIIGPFLALVICFLAVYESGTAAIISVIVVFAVAQFVENNFVRPYVFGKVMNVHPVVIFLFLFIAAEYLGLVGVIFAPALAALCSVLFEELYLKKI